MTVKARSVLGEEQALFDLLLLLLFLLVLAVRCLGLEIVLKFGAVTNCTTLLTLLLDSSIRKLALLAPSSLLPPPSFPPSLLPYTKVHLRVLSLQRGLNRNRGLGLSALGCAVAQCTKWSVTGLQGRLALRIKPFPATTGLSGENCSLFLTTELNGSPKLFIR